MIISIAAKKSFSTGLFLQFTFSYSITTAKIEQYVSDMLKKHSRAFYRNISKTGSQI